MLASVFVFMVRDLPKVLDVVEFLCSPSRVLKEGGLYLPERYHDNVLFFFF